ncbi:DUF1993 family protein [Rhodoferax sp.]|uniref:DUF1993 domain-containing protein n=1 Tax=Rhodoferax sp. TaxID=50421 RepID=UPI00374D4DC1
MYAASVSVFQRYLGQLAKMLQRAEASGLDPNALLQARLVPDMLPLALQAEIASNFAVRACAPLAGLEVPPFGEAGNSFAALQARIARVQQFLAALTPAQLADGAQRICTDQAGQASVSLPGAEFLALYALPNFFFHLTNAYAILRQQGVALGKADFDGWHAY